MTKYLLFVFLFIFCGDSFAQAYEPPSCFLFHEDAQKRLNFLQSQPQPSDSNILEIVVLMNNLAFHGNNKLVKKAQKLLKKHLKKDTTTVVVVYRNSLKLLEIRDRGKTRNYARGFGSFLGISKDPRKEGREAYDNIRLALQNDFTNIQLRLVVLGITIESSEPLDSILEDAHNDLLWLQVRIDQLDSAEAFFYNLSWAKYYYKLASIEERKLSQVELKDALDRITFAEQFAVIDDYCNEAYIWQLKIDSLQTK